MMKQQLIEAVKLELDSKHQLASELVKQLQESLFSESKSSAGDKHETARAMVQIELEQASKQLLETETFISQFSKISTLNPVKIGLGSLIQTQHSWFYLSIPLGKIQVDEIEIFCIGIQAPLAILFTNKQQGDSIKFGDKEYTIIKVGSKN